MIDLPEPLVTTDWLAGMLGAPGLCIVDASWRLPDQGDARRDYERRHIPGAVFFPIDAIADRNTDLPHMLPPPDQFEAAIGALGVSDKEALVVYDDAGLFSAPRVWWTFRAMGHERVAVLDGGLKKWLSENRPVTDEPTKRMRAHYAARFEPQRVADSDAVRSALADPDMFVVDARPAARFGGLQDEPRPGLRRGHMPGARSLPAAELVAADGTLKPPAELRRIFAHAGLSSTHKAIATCGSGVTAAVIDLALEAIGCSRHAVYDGSWAEWGRADNDPARYPAAREA